MNLEEHEKAGWKQLQTFGYSRVIIVKDGKKMLFDIKNKLPSPYGLGIFYNSSFACPQSSWPWRWIYFLICSSSKPAVDTK